MHFCIMEAGRQTTCPGDYLLGAPPQCCFDATVLCKWGQWRSYLTSQWGGQKLETLWSQKRVWYCHRTRHSCNFHPLTNWKAHIWCQCWSRQSAGCQSQTDVDGICVVIKKKRSAGAACANLPPKDDLWWRRQLLRAVAALILRLLSALALMST